jgi:thiol-disulfide isomerase/thioredoxin
MLWFLGAIFAVFVAVAVALGFALVPEGDRGGPPLTGAMEAFDLNRTPMPAPEISFIDAAGNTITLDAFRGQVVLMNLWATWCAPCVEEMPSLDRLQAELGGTDFQVVALSIDRGGIADILPFYEQHGIEHLAAYADPTGQAPPTFGAIGLPTTVLINRRGRVIGTYQGPADWDDDAAKALVQYYL